MKSHVGADALISLPQLSVDRLRLPIGGIHCDVDRTKLCDTLIVFQEQTNFVRYA